jgi:DNA polymerase-4
MAMARRLCPRAIVVPVRHSRYRDVSRQVFSVFERYTPMIEPLSLDEAFLDVTGSERLHGSGPDIARRIRAEIKHEVQLTASVGVARNKFLAKLASDMNKPDGLTVVPPDKIESILEALPVSRMWGVGPRTADMLAGLAVKTIGDLRRVSFDALARRVGREEAEHFQKHRAGTNVRRGCERARSAGKCPA